MKSKDKIQIQYFYLSMAGNTFGTIFKLSTFGESHGAAMGGVIDGCPAGLAVDFAFIQSELDRRKPGQSSLVSQRKEADKVEFLSGIFEGKTTGTPIGFIIPNTDQRPKDYDHLPDAYRPSHADYTYDVKYGRRDWRGGGRSSARETVSWVVAGAIAKLVLAQHKIRIQAFTSQVGDIKLLKSYGELNLEKTDLSPVRCPDGLIAQAMEKRIEQVRKEGDTIGGIITCVISGSPTGLGEPVFDKLHADLAKAMLSINAAKGFEYGSGFEGVRMRGSEHNDLFKIEKKKIRTQTNFSGGVQGGISNGEDIYFRVAFKPVSTLMKKQKTVNSNKEVIELKGKGRHDPCVVPRAVPVVEAMSALVMVDHLLRNNSSREF